MKYVFILVLLIVGAVAGAHGRVVVAYRWVDNMTRPTPRGAGRAVDASPRARSRGAQLARSGAARGRRDAEEPDQARRRPRWRSGRSSTTSTARPATAPRARAPTGPVSTQFIPTPDLTNAELQAGADGYWHSYIVVGGAVMPAYGEALSVAERWDIVNYLRTLAKKG